jgi:short-subunit dehydrogenase
MASPSQPRLVLITGASTGIGRAAAGAFVERGDRVLGIARSTDKLDDVAADLGGPPRFTPIVADVTDAASMDAMTKQVLQDHGLPDVVIANAGIGVDALLAETTDELLHEVLEVNVAGTLRTVRPFVRGMTERGSGRILLISSVVGKRGIPHYAAYSGSKFALHGMADALRVELWGSGVSVGVVCPSSTESEFHARKRRRGPEQDQTRLAKHSAESVARAIVKMAGSRRRELVLSAEGKLMTGLNKLLPGLVDRVLARVMMRKRG